MALATEQRLFVAYVPGRWALSSEDEVLGGLPRTKLAAAPPSSTGTVSAATGEVRPGAIKTPVEADQLHADVLVVDDDADVRWTVAEILRSAGFSVAEAEDGEIALDLLGAGSYRMILLDMRMPKRDGVSLIEALEEVPPVIVHTAYSLDVADRERLGARVVDYLHKPVSPQKLLRAVESALAS